MDRLTASPPPVFTFPADKPFIDLLAAHVIGRYGADPLALPQVLLLLPSRRACLSFREAALRRLEGRPSLLPRLRPLGDVDEDDLIGENWLIDEAAALLPHLPPAIPPLRRQVLLALLVKEAGLVHSGQDGPAARDMEKAAQLACELARLLDDMAREGLSFEGLDRLVPAELSRHWQKTVDFLEVISRRWPRRLEEEGVMDPLVRRNLLLRAQADCWRRNPPAYPVIAAGSTGSQAATAALLKAVITLPRGSVILPGLERDMSEEEWEAAEASHPQFGLRQLLAAMEVKRRDVGLLDDPGVPAACAPERVRLLRLAMCPAALTARWREESLDVGEALHGLARMECDTPREEARAVALRIREALEIPGRTVAVVTHDRVLARMVASEMRRYDVLIDDTAGRPLMKTAAGVFLRLLAEMAASAAAPVPLLALLKHPLCAAGMGLGDCQRMGRRMERLVIRGVRTFPGLDGIRRAMMSEENVDIELLALLDALEAAAGPLLRAMQRRRASFHRLLALHIAVAERLAATEVLPGGERLWSGEEGQALAETLDHLRGIGDRVTGIGPRHYPGLLETLLAGQVYRPAFGLHPRVDILSPIEARMQHYDVIILAGLNEGAWPKEPSVSPWMSRPMQKQFGLPLPEEAIGKAAHDFTMLACAKEVVFTRARKVEGALTTPTRWLLRLDTLLACVQGGPFRWPVPAHMHWARQEEAAESGPFRQPAPRPPADVRPRMLPVTEIERWQRDPYAIYARHILKLKKLDPIDREPDARDFGVLVHAVMDRFARAWPQDLPEAPEAALLACTRLVFDEHADRPAVQAFWRPRFEAMVEWLIAREKERRASLRYLFTESKGVFELETPRGRFVLKTTVDRMEQHHDGSFSLIDYKTGGLPDTRDMREGISLQLPLEALIVQQGKLENMTLDVSDVRMLEYWRLAGRRHEVLRVAESGEEAKALIGRAAERLRMLVEAYEDEQMPYLASPDERYRLRHNDYAHLERIEEWEWQDENC